MESERRRYTRYIPLKQNAFAALGQSFTKTGKIKDISVDGLSFEYVAGQSKPENDDSRVDIFLTDIPLHIRSVTCRTIYDNLLSRPQMQSDISGSLTVRRTGVQFITLSETQRSQLNFLISISC
jgi:hypothetical protein